MLIRQRECHSYYRDVHYYVIICPDRSLLIGYDASRRDEKINMFITVRRYALHGLSYRNSVCPSVCHTHGLCPHGSTYDHDFFTIW